MHVEISSLGSSGEGVGSLDGLKVFVPGALPGERVTIQITTQKKNYAVGKLLAVVNSSNERTTPPCPYFGTCGGCQLMHLTYEGQLKAKRQRVADALKRIGGLSIDVAPCVPSPQPLAYRNKIQLPVVWENGTSKMGLYRAHSHEVIPIDRCLIQCAQGEAILQKLRPLIDNPRIRYVLIRNGVFTQEALVLLVTTGGNHEQLAEKLMEIEGVCGVVESVNKRPGNTILGKTFQTLAGTSHISERLLDLTFQYSAPAFFQVNSWQAEQLYSHALELAELKGTEHVIDAYCGVGTLALLFARHARSVLGIECIPQAIKDARTNASQNGLSNCQFVCGLAEKKIGEADVVLLNPPRKGCAPELLDSLRAPTLLYISCDPATLARDLAKLTSCGYHAQTATPFDMFPQTMHVETVVKLTRCD